MNSKLNPASYFLHCIVHEIINHCKSIEIIFEIPTFLVNPLSPNLVYFTQSNQDSSYYFLSVQNDKKVDSKNNPMVNEKGNDSEMKEATM